MITKEDVLKLTNDRKRKNSREVKQQVETTIARISKEIKAGKFINYDKMSYSSVISGNAEVQKKVLKQLSDEGFQATISSQPIEVSKKTARAGNTKYTRTLSLIRIDLSI